MGQHSESKSVSDAQPEKPRLLDQVRASIRMKHYSPRTEKSYVHWIKRFIYFTGKRHPRELGAAEVSAFLSHLATERNVAAATQNQALSALLFLYSQVLELDLPWLEGMVRAKRPVRLPVVLSEGEVRALLAELEGTRWLMASLLYGAGLRLRECLKLRVKDIDFSYHQIMVHGARWQGRPRGDKPAGSRRAGAPRPWRVGADGGAGLTRLRTNAAPDRLSNGVECALFPRIQ